MAITFFPQPSHLGYKHYTLIGVVSAYKQTHPRPG